MQRGQSNAVEAVEHALDLVPATLFQTDASPGWGQDLERRWAGRDVFAGEVESVVKLLNRFLGNGTIGFDEVNLVDLLIGLSESFSP